MTREQFWKFMNAGIPDYDELKEEFDTDAFAFKKKYNVDSPKDAYYKIKHETFEKRLAPFVHYPVTEDFSKKSGIKSWSQLKGKQILPNFYSADADTEELDDINDFINDTATVEYWAPAFEKFGNAYNIDCALYGTDSNFDESVPKTYDPDNLGSPGVVFATDDPDWEKNLMKTAKKSQIDAAIRKAMKQQKTITDAVQDWK